jgi:hypothetical protein
MHHGDCVGVDADMHDLVRSNLPDVRIVVHPPSVDAARAFKDGDASRASTPYLIRNRAIVRDCDQIYAFSGTNKEVVRSGTWSTIRYAIKSKKPVTVIYPRGRIENK